MKRDWEARHRGPQASSRIALLEEGLEYQSVGIPPEDAQFLETREFQVIEVCRWFNLPPHKLRDMSAASYNSLEQEQLSFVTETLTPWLERVEAELNWKLFGDGKAEAWHDVAGLLRGDKASRYAAYNTGRQGGWLSVNDIRRAEGMPPIEGGDTYLSPLNMTPAQEPARATPTPSA